MQEFINSVGNDGTCDDDYSAETLVPESPPPPLTDGSHTSHAFENTHLPYGPHQKFSRGDEMYSLEEELTMVPEQKFICSLHLLLEVLVSRCQTPGCSNTPNIKYHFMGTALIFNSTCLSGHEFRFCSLSEVNSLYVNNIQISAAVLLSWCNYLKVHRMAQFINLAFHQHLPTAESSVYICSLPWTSGGVG